MKQKSKTPRLLIIFIALVAIVLGWFVFGPSINAPENKYFYISTGSDYNKVKEGLNKNHILSYSFLFDELAKFSKYDKHIKPGKYKINDGMSMFNLLRMLRSGRQTPVNLTIIKLHTKEELARKLGENFEFDSTAAINFLTNKDSLSKFDLDTNTVLTTVIPNTYVLLWNTGPSKVFRKLYAQNVKFWNSERKGKATNQHLDEKEIYILASLVEEETNKNDDKGKIASVYINRLNKNMKLAADPTVKYAMKDFGLKRIYLKYLSFPSPYNTYLHTGLPPGPICTPSVKTLDAVLNAPATDYLFFVAKPDFSGYSNFAVSYNEHERNAKAYQHALDSVILAKENKRTETP